MSSERELGPRARIVQGLSGILGIDASGEVLTPTPSDLMDSLIRTRQIAGKIDFRFSPPRRDRRAQDRMFDELSELRMAAGE